MAKYSVLGNIVFVATWVLSFCMMDRAQAGVPVANAGTDLAGVLQQPMLLRGWGYDTEGLPITSYRWTQHSGPTVSIQNANQATATVVLQQEAEYVFFFTVSNGTQSSEPDILAIRFLSQPNRHPQAQVNATKVCVTAGQSVLLDGSGSRDPDGDAMIYEWRQLVGTVLTLPDPRKSSLAISPTSVGFYLFKFTVSDTKLSDAPIHIEVYVGDPKPCASEPIPEPPTEPSMEFIPETTSESSTGTDKEPVLPSEESSTLYKDGGTGHTSDENGGVHIEAKGCQCQQDNSTVFSAALLVWLIGLLGYILRKKSNSSRSIERFGYPR